MAEALIIIGFIYVVGFIFNLVLLSIFGKKMGFDYSEPHDAYYDDYANNRSAYASFSLAWFIFLPVMIIRGCWWLLLKLAGLIIKD